MSTTPSNPSLNPQEIRQILDALEQSEWDEAVVTVGDVSISLSRNGASLDSVAPATPPAAPALPPVAAAAAPVAAGAPPTEAAAPAAPASDAATGVGEGVPVLSPTVGILWRSPEPGAKPFVEVGQKVQKGDIVCIVEVMKLMNNVTAPVSGTVTGIAIENAGSVEFDQVLLTIAPEGS